MNATVPPQVDEASSQSELVLTHLARARIEVEDQATTDLPTTAMLRIGDDTAGVRLVDDLLTIQRLVAEADRQLTRLFWQRRHG